MDNFSISQKITTVFLTKGILESISSTAFYNMKISIHLKLLQISIFLCGVSRLMSNSGTNSVAEQTDPS